MNVGLERDFVCVARRLKGQLSRMKHQGVHAPFGSQKSVVRLVSVAGVSHNRVTKVTEMQSNLMKAPGAGCALDQAVPRSIVWTHGMVDGASRKRSIGGSGFLGFVAVGRGQRFFHDSLVLGPSPDNREIRLFRSAMHEFQLERVQRISFLGKQHNATGGFVQAMHRLQPLGLWARFVQEITQIVRFVVVDVRSMHQQATGFYHCRPTIAFVQDAKPGFCTLGR